MPRRAARLGALAAAAVLSLSACGWSSPIRTQEMYAPSDGIRLDLAEDVRVENLMVLTGGNFADGWVLGSVAVMFSSSVGSCRMTFLEGKSNAVILRFVTDKMPALTAKG